MKNSIYTSLVALFIIVSLQVSAQTVTEQTRQVSGFSSLASSGPFNVHVKLNGTESLKISADDALINDIETTVIEETLTIRFKKGFKRDKSSNKIDVYVTAKNLKALVNSGSGSINVDGTINTNNFSAVLSGSGSISSDIKTKELRAVISGSGSINITGSASEASVTVSGSGNMRAKDLGTESTSATVTGSGNVYVAATKTVNARIIGSGQVVYSGDAKVQSSTIGSGKVTKAN